MPIIFEQKYIQFGKSQLYTYDPFFKEYIQ